jgi:uncharacterized membrane protein HdeD (DUF308 family)
MLISGIVGLVLTFGEGHSRKFVVALGRAGFAVGIILLVSPVKGTYTLTIAVGV